MATNKIVHANTEAYVAILQAATFGTAVGESGNGIILECPVPTPDFGLFKDMNMKNTKSRVLEESHMYTTSDGGIRTIPISDIIVRKNDLAELFYAVMQNVSEGATTPYTKTYTWAGVAGTETTQPDFGANAGYFADVSIYSPIASTMHGFLSCIARSLTVRADLLSGSDGRLMADVEFISGHDNTTGYNVSGTNAFNAQTYFNFFRPTTATIGALDVILYGFNITFTNNAYRIGLTSAGNCETFALPRYQVTGSITCKWDANTDGLIDDMKAGTSKAIQIATGTGAADGHFDMTFAACEITGAPKDYGGEQGQVQTIEFEATADSATGALAVVTISDANDQSW
jgi:hypothetical protein